MKKIATLIPAALLLLLPIAAGAHEHAIIKTETGSYQVVVGSLNEPIATGDKTGVELMVNKCATAACAATMGEDGDMDGPVGPAVEGLDETLKVEVSAGKEKRTFDFNPVWGEEGAYVAPFYPTAATTYSYRVFGTIEGAAVDMTFTCLAAGAEAKEDHTAKDLGNGVTQTMRGGGFSCPADRSALEFPKKGDSGASPAISYAALALAIVAIGASFRKKQ